MLRDVGCMQDILYANSCKYKTRITNIRTYNTYNNIIRGFILEFKIFFFATILYFILLLLLLYILLYFILLYFILNYSTLNSIIVCKLYSLQKFIPASSKII